MKIIIQSDNATKEDLTDICKWIRNTYKTTKTHVNVLIEEGTREMTLEEIIKFMKEVFEDD